MRHKNLGKYSEPRWSVSSSSRTYQRFAAMRQRIATSARYAHLDIHPDWDDFEKFVSDMGECPEGYSLDRIDNNKGYSKENCRWIPRGDQSKNRKFCIMVGKLTLKEFARENGVPYGTLYHRVKNMGMSPITALEYKRGNNGNRPRGRE